MAWKICRQLSRKIEMTILVDFDGTVVTHEFPEIGKDIGAVPVLKELVANGHQLIIFTMRSKQGLLDAVQWYKDNEIPLYGVNENPTQKVWTDSPKAHGNLIIDDIALGVPLLAGGLSRRPWVDWKRVREYLVDIGAIKEKENES